MRNELVEFDCRLRTLGGETAVRPFLCQGSPFGCDIFLVGINPRTNVPLWPYWSVENGADKAGWLDAYLKKEGALRPTRARIERLIKAVAPARVLETNVFHHRSDNEAELTKDGRTTEVFDFLLTTVKPKIVFVHGKSAIEHIQLLTSTRFRRAEFTSVRYRGIQFDVIVHKHLSRGWSFDNTDRFGSALREHWMGCAGGEHNWDSRSVSV